MHTIIFWTKGFFNAIVVIPLVILSLASTMSEYWWLRLNQIPHARDHSFNEHLVSVWVVFGLPIIAILILIAAFHNMIVLAAILFCIPVAILYRVSAPIRKDPGAFDF